MQIIDGATIASASDLVLSATCEYAVLRRTDAVRGIGDPLPKTTDALMKRAAGLGIKHEDRLLQQMSGVVEIEQNHGVRAAMRDTLAAIDAGAPVVAQGVFFDGRMLGIADFLIRQDDGAYEIADAKLARREKTTALLQIGVYAELAAAAGVTVSPTGALLLGNGMEYRTEIARLTPVVRARRQRLEEILEAHIATGELTDWNDPAITMCGRCDLCAAQVEATHDVLLVSGLRMTQRAKLRAAGIETIEQLAQSQDAVPHMAERTRAALQAQASLQVQQMSAPVNAVGPQVSFDVFDPNALAAIPVANAGDIFFDFEGDPLWQDPTTGEWGLEYLFGVVEAPVAGADPVFRPFWAHDRLQEAKALRDFLDYVAARRARFPGMHIYHYADYERAALLRLAVRHGIGEDEVDDLLRQNVLVDLFPIVRRSLRVSQPSYSLKKLEPLYMGDQRREGGVTTAGDSVVEYAYYCEFRDSGDTAAAAERLADIADYNQYDCESTLGLRDWLSDLATRAGVAPAVVPVREGAPETAAAEEDLVAPLLAYATPSVGAPRTAEQTAVALAAAAVGYYRREAKPYWWQHYARLGLPLDEIRDRGAMIVDDIEIEEDWHLPPKAKKPRRASTILGQLPAGSDIKSGSDVFLLYDAPHPAGLKDGGPETRGWRSGKVKSASVDADGYDRLEITESTDRGTESDDIPTVICAGAGPNPGSVQTALEELAAGIADRLAAGSSDPLPSPVRDLLLRRPPRLVGNEPLPEVIDGDFISAITAAVRRLDGSTLAVQGPPGTGKTHVGGHVIAALVADGWRVGVVSQGHAAVNHLLDGVVKAGVAPEQVGKKQRPAASVWTDIPEKPKGKYADFLRSHEGRGCVVGGTAWDFTHLDKVGRGELDLLVIDEAGQYSLANTLAVSVSAKRLLLLGDPQQLPQVSQGTHPEPVDTSALGWLSQEHTLPAEYGYFLDTSWRMHPAVTAAVSRLSYEGRLGSKESVTKARRMLDGSGQPVEPGVFWTPVEHRGNDVESAEEAEHVVELVREALTWSWLDPACEERPRPMTGHDILVVAPYNGQRAVIDVALHSAGITGVRVGTVDKFQGQEAPLTIVSMTASSPADVPRGMGFLVSPNRLNVAVSRAQWRSVIISSPALTDYLPSSVSGLWELGGFLGLLGI